MIRQPRCGMHCKRGTDGTRTTSQNGLCRTDRAAVWCQLRLARGAVSLAQRFGGKYSPNGSDAGNPSEEQRTRRVEVDPAGGRSNLLFIPAIVLVATSFNDGAISLLTGLYDPTKGSAEVFGIDMFKDFKNVRKFLGICP